MMILAIDGYEANAGVRVGIGRYAFELIDRIAAMQARGKTPFDEIRVYLPEEKRAHMPPETARFRYRVCRPKRLWTFVGFPLALRSDAPRADVVFSPTHYIPRFVTVPRVMAIMDVSYLQHPDLFRPQDLHKLVHWTAYSVQHAAAVVTISEFSKNAIIQAYDVAPDRVTVAYPALPDSIRKQHMGIRTQTAALPKRYILSVGTLQPRKNFSRLIEAFSRLQDKDLELLIVGKKGWLYDEILASPKKFGVESRVRFLDFVSDEDLPGLYDHAECFALPSLYEGFGLPVLEAMAHGVPVVVSNTSSLPEIAGDAGVYVEPEDVSSIASGLQRVLSEKGSVRAARIAKGKARAGTFTWDAAAKSVMDVLVQVGTKGSA